MKDLKGKWVLITGAGSGLGRLMSIAFAAEGANLILWDIQFNLLEETKKIVESDPKVQQAKHNISIELQHCDLSNKNAIYEAADVRILLFDDEHIALTASSSSSSSSSFIIHHL
jgi:NAD(P)-dependent dehydrogenase (short-subunit alcohol dehydrogenase family)